MTTISPSSTGGNGRKAALKDAQRAYAAEAKTRADRDRLKKAIRKHRDAVARDQFGNADDDLWAAVGLSRPRAKVAA